MKKELLKIGFQQNKEDPCLYVYIQKEIRLFVYINDLAAAAPEARDLD
jgi:hypothetical protein